MKKRQNKILIVILCAFITIGFVATLLTPSRAFSPMENRTLAQMPELTAKSFFSGKFMSDFEKYLTDQFFARDVWVGMKYYCERALLKQENNGIYISGDRLFMRFDAPEDKRVTANLNAVEQLSQTTGVPVLFSLIPTSAYIYADQLPKYAPTYNQQELLDKAALLPQYFDLSQTLLGARGEDIYYRTDHHWTSLGAYTAYRMIAQQLGYEPLALPENGVAVPDFYGTLFSQGGVRGIAPDEITYYPMDNLSLYADGEDRPLYELKFAEEKDKYSLFLGGNWSTAVIRNENVKNGEKLVIVRDSFTNALAPLLAQHVSELHLVDPRYYKLPLAQYVQENDIDRVLVLYQTANFVQDSSIVLTARP